MRIILFDIDCLRPDHLGCYGYHRPTSPNIDRIAGQGVRFNNYFCADSPCLPSRMGFASGRFGINNGVVSNHSAGAKFQIKTRGYVGPEPENEMLMRRLRTTGLDTISISNFADRHNMFWYTCGFSEFHTPNLKGGQETAEEIHVPVMRWLKQNATRENYLLHINYWDTHRIYKMDESWADRFADHPVEQSWPDDDAIKQHQSLDGYFTANRQFKDNKSTVPLMPGAVNNRKDFQHMLTGYDASIAYVDHHVGIVLEELQKQGVLDDAVLIVTSDHGDAFGEHGIYSDHVNADECIHNIPLVIKWPGQAKPDTQCDSMVYNVDLSATLCEMLGAEIPEQWDGVSFAPQLRGQPGNERDYLVWSCALYAVQRAVRTRQHLMIRTYDHYDYGTPPVELFDIQQDKYQTTNLAESHPEIVQRCDHLMNQWLHDQRVKPSFTCDPLAKVMAERKLVVKE